MIKIRPAQEKDFDEIWRIFQSEDTSKIDAHDKWMNKAAKTFVAELNEKIVGAYVVKPNHLGRGSHIANASYMVDESTRGAGVGKSLALHSIQTAKDLGYKAIQFNFVVSTNKAAVNLWKSVGFQILATIPKAFNHKDLGYVDSYVMFLELN
jgi:L-amino acid N-acyltransferase YncA